MLIDANHCCDVVRCRPSKPYDGATYDTYAIRNDKLATILAHFNSKRQETKYKLMNETTANSVTQRSSSSTGKIIGITYIEVLTKAIKMCIYLKKTPSLI